jgi:transcriptional regulator with XRE-family HTH domain
MSRELDKIDKDLKEAIAIRITELREGTGKNQTQFAYDYGKDKQTQNRFEKGRGATIYTINKFCIALGITIAYFFDSPLFEKKKK